MKKINILWIHQLPIIKIKIDFCKFKLYKKTKKIKLLQLQLKIRGLKLQLAFPMEKQ